MPSSPNYVPFAVLCLTLLINNASGMYFLDILVQSPIHEEGFIYVHEMRFHRMQINSTIHLGPFHKQERVKVKFATPQDPFQQASLDMEASKLTQTTHLLAINITISYQMICQKWFYGDKCDKYCLPMDSNEGHYTCSDLGEKICRRGFTGDDCQQVEACRPLTCLNNGTCQTQNNDFQCICPPLFTGHRCEQRLSTSIDSTTTTSSSFFHTDRMVVEHRIEGVWIYILVGVSLLLNALFLLSIYFFCRGINPLRWLESWINEHFDDTTRSPIFLLPCVHTNVHHPPPPGAEHFDRFASQRQSNASSLHYFVYEAVDSLPLPPQPHKPPIYAPKSYLNV